MKIEKGMYVRTDTGQIAKSYGEFYESSVDIGIGIMEEVNGIWIDNKCINYIDKKYIIKTSFNLIDLIEVGDILHSKNDDQYWTVENYLYEKGKCINIEWEVLDSEEEFLENIDEIITKEQAKSVSYKIGE